MEIMLENELLTVKAAMAGAEITSIMDKKDHTEYIWSGDAKFWGRHAPILFPIIGKLKGNAYRMEDKVYSLAKHGFARDCRFELVEKSGEKAMFRLNWSDETLAVYPYRFELDVLYILRGNTLEVSYTVRNVDDGNIYFSIGGHPGFNCPIGSGEAFEDYYFEFETSEKADTIQISGDGLLKKQTRPLLNDSAVIPLSHELFVDDALVFSNLKSQRVSLKSKMSSKGIAVDFSGFPYLGLWSQKGEAPFVCIEPWLGLADFEDFDGKFSQKPGVLELGKGREFNCRYTITIMK